MNRLLVALGAAGAIALGAGAAAVGAEAGVSLALAGGAVGVAAVTLVAVAWPEPEVVAGPSGPSSFGLVPWQEWVRGGELGHEEIVRLLDRIDRMGSHPNLPMRTEQEMRVFRGMPRARFLEMVDRRLDELEGPA